MAIPETNWKKAPPNPAPTLASPQTDAVAFDGATSEGKTIELAVYAEYPKPAAASTNRALNGDVIKKGPTSVGAGLGGAFFQFVSGMAIAFFSAKIGYSYAYTIVFAGYGIISMIGIAIVLFTMGPIVKNPYLYAQVKPVGEWIYLQNVEADQDKPLRICQHKPLRN